MTQNKMEDECEETRYQNVDEKKNSQIQLVAPPLCLLLMV
jgi:hypothetical protein